MHLVFTCTSSQLFCDLVNSTVLHQCTSSFSHVLPLNYFDLVNSTQIPTLENRRINLKLCTLFKIIHGLFPFTPDVFQPSRHHHNLPLLYQPYACTNAFQSSFVPSTISIWNHLPYDALIAPSLHTFKLNIAPFVLVISLSGYILVLA